MFSVPKFCEFGFGVASEQVAGAWIGGGVVVASGTCVVNGSELSVFAKFYVFAGSNQCWKEKMLLPCWVPLGSHQWSMSSGSVDFFFFFSNLSATIELECNEKSSHILDVNFF